MRILAVGMLLPALFAPAVAPSFGPAGVSSPVNVSREWADAGLLAPAAGVRDFAAGDWKWPVGPPHSVSRPFEAPPTRFAAGHRGIDITTAPGLRVYAPAPGVVSFAGVVVDRPLLSIAHPGDLVSSLEPVQPAVTPGERVSAGQLVGVVASGGHCAAGCLHFGVRLHGQYVSPILMLGSIPRAVLMPLDDG
jgi:murein DD-endopeptidase MepM/ murein hydrolase activator NlpD